MQKEVKSFISIFAVLIIMFCTVTTASAAETRLSNTSSVSVWLAFSGTTAYCDAKVTGANGTTSITNGYLILTDSQGTVVANWSNLSSNSDKLTVSKSTTGLKKGETYTLTFSAKVNKNNKIGYDSLSKNDCPIAFSTDCTYYIRQSYKRKEHAHYLYCCQVASIFHYNLMILYWLNYIH